jgi:5-(carboxyamino)imidazole ribonucleotide mutase
MAKIALIMGSKSDFETCRGAMNFLRKIGVEFSVRIISAHRTPDDAREFAKSAHKNGVRVIIAAAGKAAHLAGVIAADTILPVIALPIKTSLAGGLDSLLSMVQMPRGVPVACVGVDAAENAGILAAQILAISDAKIADKLEDFKEKMKSDVRAMNAEIENF